VMGCWESPTMSRPCGRLRRCPCGAALTRPGIPSVRQLRVRAGDPPECEPIIEDGTRRSTSTRCRVLTRPSHQRTGSPRACCPSSAVLGNRRPSDGRAALPRRRDPTPGRLSTGPMRAVSVALGSRPGGGIRGAAHRGHHQKRVRTPEASRAPGLTRAKVPASPMRHVAPTPRACKHSGRDARLAHIDSVRWPTRQFRQSKQNSPMSNGTVRSCSLRHRAALYYLHITRARW
jgi:hypothetical protein